MCLMPFYKVRSPKVKNCIWNNQLGDFPGSRETTFLGCVRRCAASLKHPGRGMSLCVVFWWMNLALLKACWTLLCFFLKNSEGKVTGLLVIHVDDIMVATDGNEESEKIVEKLHKRLPFGEWSKVCEQPHGVKYCGKELRIDNREGEDVIVVSQRGFVEGRLEEIPIDGNRKKEPLGKATEMEITDYRSTVGSLQWLATQSRPDIAFETNQLQKRVPDSRIEDLVRANRLVREVKKHDHEIILRNIGKDWKLVVFHDAALFNSVGAEIDEREADDLLFKTSDKKLVFSQKGCVLGFVNSEDVKLEGEKCNFNLIDWKSSTNKRVIESSFAGGNTSSFDGARPSPFLSKFGDRDEPWQRRFGGSRSSDAAKAPADCDGDRLQITVRHGAKAGTKHE